MLKLFFFLSLVAICIITWTKINQKEKFKNNKKLFYWKKTCPNKTVFIHVARNQA